MARSTEQQPQADKLGTGTYPFYRSNIHEHRRVAVLFRSLPILALLLTCSVTALGALWRRGILLWVCMLLNVGMWLWIVSCSLFGLHAASSAVLDDPQQGVQEKKLCDEGVGNEVSHMIVLPNYKEEENMLEQTVLSLSEATGSSSFRVVLAMEEREGVDAHQKAARLQLQFENKFKWIIATYHPMGLDQDHMDGSSDAEIPGKASNLKYAVNEAYAVCKLEASLDLSSVILSVADADCLFHPNHFSYISKDFDALRTAPGDEQKWAMWQSPQLSFRNWYDAPVCSRAWGYISAVFESGGVGGLSFGCRHMAFSAYSLPLQLAFDAQPWDGDSIAEDHHCYLRCFFYSMFVAADDETHSIAQSGLRSRPVLFPVKSTMVISSKGYWHSWIERWHQAKRHAQGLAELPYGMLAAYDAFTTLPLSKMSVKMWYRIFRVLLNLWGLHLLPIAQSICFTVLSVMWFANDRQIDMCPTEIWIAEFNKKRMLLCGLAGAWALTWPLVIPMILVVLTNCVFLSKFFIGPGRRREESTWNAEDGHIPPTCGSKYLTMIAMTCVDCFVFTCPLMLPYGLVVYLLANVNACLYGNRSFEYVTAAKETTIVSKNVPAPTYGATTWADAPPDQGA